MNRLPNDYGTVQFFRDLGVAGPKNTKEPKIWFYDCRNPGRRSPVWLIWGWWCKRAGAPEKGDATMLHGTRRIRRVGALPALASSILDLTVATPHAAGRARPGGLKRGTGGGGALNRPTGWYSTHRS
jgi:hypothetical protein